MNGTTFKQCVRFAQSRSQITTARDLSRSSVARSRIVSRNIISILRRGHSSITVASAIANHNHLLGRVDGMSTESRPAIRQRPVSTCCRRCSRDGRHVVGVVLGGRSYSQRDTDHGRPDRRQSAATRLRAARQSPSQNARTTTLDAKRARDGIRRRTNRRKPHRARRSSASRHVQSAACAAAESLSSSRVKVAVGVARPRQFPTPPAKIEMRAENGRGRPS